MSVTARAPFVAVVVIAVTAVAASSCSTKPDDEQPSLDRKTLLDPETCKTCHAEHYAQWAGSMHAYASDDPVFRAMNRRGQRETGGALGDFCVKCHAPMAVREKATKDGLDLDAVPAVLKGITCFFCHSVDRVEDSHNSGVGLATDLAMRGEYADPVKNTAHRATYSALHDRDRLESADMCGACHDLVTPLNAPIERTFAEWKASVFAHVPGGATCAQCHMPQSKNQQPIAQAPGVFARRTHDHSFPGVDVAITPFPSADDQRKRVEDFLATTVQSALCVSTAGGETRLRVVLDNVAAGHGFPSGAAQDRRLWTEINAYAGDAVVYQTGVVADDAATTTNADPDRWLLRDCILDASGKEVKMFWQAAAYEGNALPAQATFDPADPRFYQTHLVQKFPRDGSAVKAAVDRVTFRLRLRPMDRDVLDDLVASGDLDPALAAAVPTLAVGEALTWTPAATDSFVDENRVPFTCVTATNLNVQSPSVPAPLHTRCAPP